MTERTILITGCSSGIGYDAAHALKAKGWRVFASCRKLDDCERLIDEGFESPRLDYTDTGSIASCVREVTAATGGRLDALFNNGAHGFFGAVEDLPTDGLRAIFEANFFGWHELTRQVIPIMRAQKEGRIVQCSSTLGLVTIPWRGAYSATKHALEALTDTMRVELRDTGIHVVTLEPGPITTKFRENGIPFFEAWIDWQRSARSAEYEDGLIKRLYEGGGKDTFELPPSAVTAKLIRALDHPNPSPRYYITTATYIAAFLRRILPTRAIDRITARI
ncbi:SDR family NAD(P)-dependent oxidoreductase [Thalassococcus sp. S3]|uniref:SDR family NAD(P)-dependent oxidoreductase n=1 Tax=Thalassococcus sp. S3 TaxID=2017482 RepID=UPI00102472FB|nr:SDR family NAD(P)-dependent oxidoreductase [Thalassococcus sp. S3]QBF30048.1 short-chain dehydrogenase [Thalassococcus sp. S3]